MKIPFLDLKNILIIFSTLILIFSTSCVEEKYDWDRLSDEIELKPGITAPLLKGSLTLEDILKEISDENTGKFSQDNLLYISYTDTFKSYLASEVVIIPDQDFSQSYVGSDITSNPEWTGSSQGDTIIFNKQKITEFKVLHNEKIDSIIVKLGFLRIYVSSTFKQRGILRITTDHIKADGQPLVRDVIISDASGTFDTTIYIVMNHAAIYPDNSNPSLSTLPFSFDLSLINSGTPVAPGEECLISMRLENIQFSSVYGYLGEYDLLMGYGEFKPAVFKNIDFEDDFVDGKLSFYDPKFTLSTNNSFGIPVEIYLSNVSAYSEKDDITTPISFTAGNPFDVNHPDINHIGQLVKDSIVIDKNNCNIVQAINTSPNILSYDISVTTNPEGPTGPYNFVTDNSRLDLAFEMLLPLWGIAKGVILEDTSDLDIEKEIGEFIDNIDYFRIKMEGTNGFPFEAALQVIFLDSVDNVLESLFTGSSTLLNPAVVGIDGQVTNGADFIKTVEFSKQKLTNIKATKKAVIRATLNTSNASSGQYVKFFSYYELDFKMSVKTNLIIKE